MAKKIRHTAQSDRQKKVRKASEEVSVREGAAARSSRPIERKVLMKQARKEKYKTDRKKGVQEPGKESQGRTCSKMQPDAWQKNIEKTASQKTEALERKSCRDTVKRSMSIPRQLKNKSKEL